MPRPLQTQHGRTPTMASASGKLDAELAPVSGSLGKLQQENARLKTEVERLRQSELPVQMNSRSVMWMACSLCGVALLFALAVLFRH